MNQLSLQPLTPEDCPTLLGWLSDPRLLIMTAPDWDYPLTLQRLERDYFGDAAKGEPLKAVSEGVMVGHVGLRTIGRGVGLLYHVIVGPPLQRRGYGRAMIEAAAAHAFEVSGMHRLQLAVFDTNVAAIACYLSAGFRVEGHHRESNTAGGHRLNHYTMALLEHEWRYKRTEDPS